MIQPKPMNHKGEKNIPSFQKNWVTRPLGLKSDLYILRPTTLHRGQIPWKTEEDHENDQYPKPRSELGLHCPKLAWFKSSTRLEDSHWSTIDQFDRVLNTFYKDRWLQRTEEEEDEDFVWSEFKSRASVMLGLVLLHLYCPVPTNQIRPRHTYMGFYVFFGKCGIKFHINAIIWHGI